MDTHLPVRWVTHPWRVYFRSSYVVNHKWHLNNHMSDPKPQHPSESLLKDSEMERLTFVYGIRQDLILSFCHLDYQLSQHDLLNGSPFPPLRVKPPLICKATLLLISFHIWISLFCSIALCVSHLRYSFSITIIMFYTWVAHQNSQSTFKSIIQFKPQNNLVN